MLVHSAFIPFYFLLSYLFNRMLNIFRGFKECPQQLPSDWPLLFLPHTTCMFTTKWFQNLANTSRVDDIVSAQGQSVDLICTSAMRTVNPPHDSAGGMAWVTDVCHHLKTCITAKAFFPKKQTRRLNVPFPMGLQEYMKEGKLVVKYTLVA